MSELNYYESPQWILQLSGYKGRRVLKLDCCNSEFIKLSQLTGIDRKLLKSKAFGANVEDNVLSYRVNKKATHLCPECLKQSPHARQFWDSKISRTCPIHQCNLINRCYQCKQAIKWSRSNLLQCECGFNFSHSINCSATKAQINFALYLYRYLGQTEYFKTTQAIYAEKNLIFNLTFDSLSRLSFFLEPYIKSCWRFKRSVSSSKSDFKMFLIELSLLSSEELAFYLFENWQHNIEQLLQQYEKRLVQKKSKFVVISNVVDFLIGLSAYFQIQDSVSMWIEEYLIDFFNRYHVRKIRIFFKKPNQFHPKTFTLPEIKSWLIELNEAWDLPRINFAKIISMSSETKYVAMSEVDSTIVMILRIYHV